METKQNIKRNRIRKYFLEATKNIILQEGAENVSVRKVADLAGYSYATIYNYFTDLNELLWAVKGVMIWEIVEYMKKEIHEPTCDVKGISDLFRAYIKFYLQNPNVFRFFYFHHIDKPDILIAESESEAEPDFNQMWNKTLSGVVMDGKLEQKDIEIISKIFIYSIHGMLTLHFSGNGYLTEEQLFNDMDRIVERLL
jgi:AcrR family transcriptional regulator